MGPIGHRVHAKTQHAFQPALIHVIKEVYPAVVPFYLGQVVVAEIVFFIGMTSEHTLQEADKELRIILPVIHGGGCKGPWGILSQMVFEVLV